MWRLALQCEGYVHKQVFKTLYDPSFSRKNEAFCMRRGWRKRSGRALVIGKETKNTSPTEGITCVHGGLLPEAAGARAKRAAVPPVVWAHLASAWRAARASAAARGAAGATEEAEPGNRSGSPAEHEPMSAEAKRCAWQVSTVRCAVQRQDVPAVMGTS